MTVNEMIKALQEMKDRGAGECQVQVAQFSLKSCDFQHVAVESVTVETAEQEQGCVSLWLADRLEG